MGLLAKLGWRDREESRSITSLPWVESSTPFNVGPGRYENTTDALSLSAVYAANSLLASSVSTLPVRAYRRSGEDRSPMANLPQLFDRMVTNGDLVPWLHQAVTSLGLRGNAFGYVTARDGMQFPVDIVWLDPSTVTEDHDSTGWQVNGQFVPREDIVHIPWFKVPGKRCGLSPLASYAATLGVGLQAQSYASDWFAGGGFPPGTFKNTAKEVPADKASEIKRRLQAAIQTRAPLVHGSDWEFTAISVPPEEAQFVETMKMTTNQVAAVYGIPPEFIGGESGSSMTYANVEQQQINFVMFTLRPWLVKLETAFSALLPERQYIRFNSDALIRADLRTRWDVNKIRVDMGAANIDEIRAQEDQKPLPNGQGQQYIKAQQITAGPTEPATGDNPPLRRIQ